MGLGGISIWQLLIILLIVVFIFGTKRLRGMGSDLGGALKGFKKALNDDEQKNEQQKTDVQRTEHQTETVAKVENSATMPSESAPEVKPLNMSKTDDKPVSTSTSDKS